MRASPFASFEAASPTARNRSGNARITAMVLVPIEAVEPKTKIDFMSYVGRRQQKPAPLQAILLYSMSLCIGVLKETPVGEKRVSLVPGDLKAVKAIGAEVMIEAGAGTSSAYTDAAYEAAGATIAKSRADLLAASQIVLFVSPQTGLEGPGKRDQLFIGKGDALSNPAAHAALAKSGALTMALELVPRITRAQSMDVLSSMATLLGIPRRPSGR